MSSRPVLYDCHKQRSCKRSRESELWWMTASGAIASIRCMRSAPVVALLSFQEPVARSSARMFPRQRPSSACVATFKMAPWRKPHSPLVSSHGLTQFSNLPLRQRAEDVLFVMRYRLPPVSFYRCKDTGGRRDAHGTHTVRNPEIYTHRHLHRSQFSFQLHVHEHIYKRQTT
jgi:hypothetical protein